MSKIGLYNIDYCFGLILIVKILRHLHREFGRPKQLFDQSTFVRFEPRRLATSIPERLSFGNRVTLIERFQAMVRQKIVDELGPWISTADAGLLASFARGILKDKAAICLADGFNET